MTVNLKFFSKLPNVGDQFALLAAHRYISNDLRHCGPEALEQPNLILLGSILQWADAHSHICGAGFISATSKLAARPHAVNCVRGPLTANRLRLLGVEAPSIYGDPGILASKLLPNHQPVQYRVGIVPHYVDAELPWIERCRQAGALIIDVLAPLEDCLRQIMACDVILSSSLHGIIFAHSYGKSALWIELSDRVKGNGFKFYDYYASVGVRESAVARVQVTSTTELASLLGRATFADQSRLVPNLEAALEKTKSELVGRFR